MSTPKVFLLSSERSGSNLITKLMNAHSSICGPSTKHLLNPSLRNLHRYQKISNENNWNEFVEDVLRLFHVDFSIWNSEFNSEELLNKVEQGDVSGLFNYMFDKETLGNGKELTFIKEIKLYEVYPFITRFFPSSKFIYLVRDPRDMALSWKKSKIHKGGLIAAARQWKIDQQQFLKCSFLEDEKKAIHCIRYEELIGDPEKNLSRLFSFLELPYEEVHKLFFTDETTVQNAQQNEAWKNLSSGILSTNSNKYLEELSVKEIAMIEKICADEMRYFAYEIKTSSDDLDKVTNDEIKKLETVEIQTVTYDPPKGVKENMEAKAQFYRRLK